MGHQTVAVLASGHLTLRILASSRSVLVLLIWKFLSELLHIAVNILILLLNFFGVHLFVLAVNERTQQAITRILILLDRTWLLEHQFLEVLRQ